MIVTVWIDKQGGSHYHHDFCPMVKEPRYHYEPIKRRMKFNYNIVYPNYIVVDNKMYNPCACIYGVRGKRR